jgi:hypothetical protein
MKIRYFLNCNIRMLQILSFDNIYSKDLKIYSSSEISKSLKKLRLIEIVYLNFDVNVKTISARIYVLFEHVTFFIFR